MEKPFYFFHSLLSTTGSGGVVQYSYWNGSVWEDFIPYSGTFNFDSSPQNTLLWIDGDAIPGDWQKTIVNSMSMFWIKVEVTSSFSTSPVGSQITAIPECQYLNMIANI
ncbi:MAG: hypothetical protein GY855_03170 [candidate division Zixibacteria bacterium]|nr:hypothetical protein [candidate division Zixibacteria bacterium]